MMARMAADEPATPAAQGDGWPRSSFSTPKEDLGDAASAASEPPSAVRTSATASGPAAAAIPALRSPADAMRGGDLRSAALPPADALLVELAGGAPAGDARWWRETALPAIVARVASLVDAVAPVVAQTLPFVSVCPKTNVVPPPWAIHTPAYVVNARTVVLAHPGLGETLLAPIPLFPAADTLKGVARTLRPFPADATNPALLVGFRDRLLQGLEALPRAPHSLQRFCELLVEPTASYQCPWKLLRALERLLSGEPVIFDSGSGTSEPTLAERHLPSKPAAPLPPLGSSSPLRRAFVDISIARSGVLSDPVSDAPR